MGKTLSLKVIVSGSKTIGLFPQHVVARFAPGGSEAMRRELTLTPSNPISTIRHKANLARLEKVAPGSIQGVPFVPLATTTRQSFDISCQVCYGGGDHGISMSEMRAFFYDGLSGTLIWGFVFFATGLLVGFIAGWVGCGKE